MTGAQVFGLLIGALMLGCLIVAAGLGVAMLKDGRERRQAALAGRRYRALVDEDRERDARLSTELQELEVQQAMSGLDEEIAEFLRSDHQ